MLWQSRKMQWPDPEPISSERLLLEPLSVTQAPAMVEVLADLALYEYTGGEPPPLDVLRERYAVHTRGQSSDGAQWWLNWVVMLRDSREPVGYVQATVEDDGSELVADIAWVITPRQQGRGIASEATQGMIGWLRSQGVGRFTAYIHPDHLASMGVARNQALHPTSVERDGEIRWEL